MAQPPAASDGETLAAMGDTDPAQAMLAWNRHTLQLVQKYQQNPPRAVRALTIVHAAMHDALALAARDTENAAAGIVAAHRAASLTLAYLYPYESTAWIEGKGLALSRASAQAQRFTPLQLERALATGERVANDAIHRALTDGADRQPVARRPTAVDAGHWRAAPPLNIHTPQELLAGEWQPWVHGDEVELHPPPPHEYGSVQFWREVEEVYQVARSLTVEQKTLADDWNLEQGSVTPAGVWNQRATEIIRAEKLDAAAAVRVLAALNAAMHDAVIACWRAKYQWWRVRPVSIIRERFDANFLPHLITPPHPAYVSGHAAMSAAAATVLAAFFPRHESTLHTLAAQAALSRLYGGIHFRSDNEEGLRLGQKIGKRALEQTLTSSAHQRAAGKNP